MNDDSTSAGKKGATTPTVIRSVPAKGLAIVTCMDARLEPLRILGLSEGDAHVIRNAGGIIDNDMLRSLAISQRSLGTKEIILIRHTDCAMMGFDTDAFEREIEAEVGAPAPFGIDPLTDLEEDLRGARRQLRATAVLPHTELITTYIYDVDTKEVAEVSDVTYDSRVVTDLLQQ